MTRFGIAIVVLLVATACATVPRQGEVQQGGGKLTLLRLQDVGAEPGSPHDQSDVEVVIQLDSEPGKVFGFQLRQDRHEAVRRGMLDLLRDAFKHDWAVKIDYTIEADGENGVIVRLDLIKQPPTAGAQVTEVTQFPITADDPILQGGRLDPEVILDHLPDPPPELSGKGAHEMMGETEWTFVDESELGPGQRQQATVSFDEPVLLQARATWFGALVPVEMTVTRDGTTLATGVAYPSPPNRGTLTADVQVVSPGSATVSVVNNGTDPVGVEMIIGVVPLSLAQ